MSALMVLELENGFSLDELISVLEKSSATVCLKNEELVVGFENSGMDAVLTLFREPQDIGAEGVGGWKVGVKLAFHCAYSRLNESWADLKSVMKDLDQIGSGRFVLTFQYESIYAIKDDSGYRLLNPMVE